MSKDKAQEEDEILQSTLESVEGVESAKQTIDELKTNDPANVRLEELFR